MIEYKLRGSKEWVVSKNGKVIGNIHQMKDDDRWEYHFDSAKGITPALHDFDRDLDELKKTIEAKYMNESARLSFKTFNESSDYKIYHSSYSDAISEVVRYIKDKGFTYNEDEFFNDITTGPKKPSDGKTNKFHIQMYKDEEATKKYIHIQVYGMGNRYELNMYIK